MSGRRRHPSRAHPVLSIAAGYNFGAGSAPWQWFASAWRSRLSMGGHSDESQYTVYSDA